MLMLAVLALILAAVPVLGGSLLRLPQVHLRRGWAVASALGLQILAISVLPGTDRALLVALHLASYALVALFLTANRRLQGLWLLSLGAVLNVTAIAANGGVMPASTAALARAGLEGEAPGQFVNSGHVHDATVGFLGDVFAVPESVPLSNVFSIGDVLIVLGAGWTLHALAGSRLPFTSRPGRRGKAQPIDVSSSAGAPAGGSRVSA